MFRLIIAIVSITILFTGCREQKGKPTTTNAGSYITGVMPGGSNSSLLIQKIYPDRFVSVDSTRLDENGAFAVELKVDYPGFYALRNEQNNYITVLCKGNGDTVKVYTDYHNFNNYNLEGSKELEEIEDLNNKTKDFLNEIAEYARILEDSSSSRNYSDIRSEIDRKYRQAFTELKEYSRDFIQRNQGSLVSLLALTNQLGRNFYVFHPVKDYEIFRQTDSLLIEKYPESEPVREIHAQLERIRLEQAKEKNMLTRGEQAPGFSLQNPEGKTISLDDFKGQLVLIDFWASWCQPCRRENPELVEVYNRYRTEGFTILGVSLDRKREDWIQAIETDKLDWHHVSELNYWNSTVAERYGVKSIPSNFLLDQNGTIIAINLGPAELDKKLDEIITKSEK